MSLYEGLSRKIYKKLDSGSFFFDSTLDFSSVQLFEKYLINLEKRSNFLRNASFRVVFSKCKLKIEKN